MGGRGCAAEDGRGRVGRPRGNVAVDAIAGEDAVAADVVARAGTPDAVPVHGAQAAGLSNWRPRQRWPVLVLAVASPAALRRGGSVEAALVVATMTGAGEGNERRRQPATRPCGFLGSGGGGIAALTAVTLQQQSRTTTTTSGTAAAGACSSRSCDSGAVGARIPCK